MGDLDKIQDVPGGLKAFIDKGGAALLASDRPPRGAEALSTILHCAGVSIHDEKLVHRGVEDCYKNFHFCPLLIPEKEGLPQLFTSGGGTLQVATNLPSMLRPKVKKLPGNLVPIASLPSDCVPQSREAENVSYGRPVLFAVGGELGKGRLLVLADHSIFINEMMLPRDNNNVEFTEKCMNWLKGSEPMRDRVLFVEEGIPQTNFNIPLKSVNLPIEEALQAIFDRRNELLAQAEQGLGSLEEHNFFNKKLFDFLESIGMPPWRLLTLLASIGSALLVFYGVYRFSIRDRFRHDRDVQPLASAVGRRFPAVPLREQRHVELVRHGNLGEPAAMLARRWFARLGMEPLDGAVPQYEVRGGWWQRRKLRARLTRLWELSCGQRFERVSAPQLWNLQRELDELRSAWERGTWRIAGTA